MKGEKSPSSCNWDREKLQVELLHSAVTCRDLMQLQVQPLLCVQRSFKSCSRALITLMSLVPSVFLTLGLSAWALAEIVLRTQEMLGMGRHRPWQGHLCDLSWNKGGIRNSK